MTSDAETKCLTLKVEQKSLTNILPKITAVQPGLRTRAKALSTEAVVEGDVEFSDTSMGAAVMRRSSTRQQKVKVGKNKRCNIVHIPTSFMLFGSHVIATHRRGRRKKIDRERRARRDEKHLNYDDSNASVQSDGIVSSFEVSASEDSVPALQIQSSLPWKLKCLIDEEKQSVSEAGDDLLDGQSESNRMRSLTPSLRFEASSPSGTSTPRKKTLEQDRIEFYRNFSLLLHLGERAMQRQSSSHYHSECQGNTSHPHLHHHRSSSARGKLDEVPFGQYLWVHLQAWKRGLPLNRLYILQSIRKIDQYLIENRRRFSNVFPDIEQFEFKSSSSCIEVQTSVACDDLIPSAESPAFQVSVEESTLASTVTDGSSSSTNTLSPAMLIAHTSTSLDDLSTLTGFSLGNEAHSWTTPSEPNLLLATQNSSSSGVSSGNMLSLKVSHDRHNSSSVSMIEGDTPSPVVVASAVKLPPSFDSAFIEQQREAMVQVSNLLKRYDALESLYSNSRMMSIDQKPNLTESIKDRLLVLRLWYNVARDLSQSIDQVGKMLNLRQWILNDTKDETANAYQRFVEKALRRKPGMINQLALLHKKIGSILKRVQKILTAPSRHGSKSVRETSRQNSSDMELYVYGVNHPAYKAMNLPAPKPLYLFLIRIPLELVHQWLRLRSAGSEKASKTDPLTLKQVISDGKDVLSSAVKVKRQFKASLKAVGENECNSEMESFDFDLARMFNMFLNNIGDWTMCWQNADSELSRGLVEALVEHWRFVKLVAIDVCDGEAIAAKHFCDIGQSMLSSVGQFLDNHVDQNFASYFVESFLNPLSDIDDNEAADDEEYHSSVSDTSYYSTPMVSSPPPAASSPLNSVQHSIRKHSMLGIARELKHVVSDAAERSQRALNFARTLRTDLEITASYKMMCTFDLLMQRMQETKHCLVALEPSEERNFYMFVKEELSNDIEYIQLLLNVTCGRSVTENPEVAGKNGYLLMILKDGAKLGSSSQSIETSISNDDALDIIGSFESESVISDPGCACAAGVNSSSRVQLFVNDSSISAPFEWKGCKIKVHPNYETLEAMRHMKLSQIQLAVVHSSQLKSQRKLFERSCGVHNVKLIDEQCSGHEVTAGCLEEMKQRAMHMRKRWVKWVTKVQSQLLPHTPDDSLLKDTILHAYNLAFDYHHNLSWLISGPMRRSFADGMRQFALQWMRFVLDHCEAGNGTRSWWSKNGLQFVELSVKPPYLFYYSDEQFIELKSLMNTCINHLIGQHHVHSSRSWSPGIAELPLLAKEIEPSEIHGINGSVAELNDFQVGNVAFSDANNAEMFETSNPQTRVFKAVQKLEDSRNEKLKAEHRVGNVVEKATLAPQNLIANKKAPFRFFRMRKLIGRGNSGDVYTALNLDSGEVIVVKEISMEKIRQNHQVLRILVDEISNFESIQHPNLVKYYGIEVHRDSILMFMEYCPEGTLEVACREGLSLQLVRYYAKYLLEAVNELHSRGIVHRDIKTANIFLTKDYGGLKLGDFGSSARLESNNTVMTTYNDQQLKEYIGTVPYMAPEVITSSGYGRAADIWSVGCVVLEMATGKPPWHQKENAMQIMYCVGGGKLPYIPDYLDPQCKDFINCCLKNNPDDRFTTYQLIDHDFVKIGSISM